LFLVSEEEIKEEAKAKKDFLDRKRTKPDISN